MRYCYTIRVCLLLLEVTTRICSDDTDGSGLPSVGVSSESSLPLSCTSNVRISRWRCLPLVTKHRSPGGFVRHAPLRACCVLYTRRVALLCPVHVVRCDRYAARSTVRCLPSVRVESSLATSKLYISYVHRYPDGCAFLGSGHEEQKPSKLRLLCPLHVVR